MMKTVAFLALVGSAAAFAPASQQGASTALSAAPFAEELGAMTPVSLF